MINNHDFFPSLDHHSLLYFEEHLKKFCAVTEIVCESLMKINDRWIVNNVMLQETWHHAWACLLCLWWKKKDKQ